MKIILKVGYHKFEDGTVIRGAGLHDIDDDRAKSLIEKGLAEPVVEEKKKKKKE